MMKTINYNERYEKRRIAIALIEGPKRIEHLAEQCGLVDELSLRHTLACLRYESVVNDAGELWELTEFGLEYAEWCRQYPQRSRGFIGGMRRPVRQRERAFNGRSSSGTPPNDSKED